MVKQSGPSDDELDLVLSGGRFVGPVADRAAERLGLGTPRAPWRMTAVTAVAVGAAAVALWLAPASSRSPGRSGSFTARGGAPSSASVELSCDRGTATSCPRGGRLTIVTSGVEGDVFVGAFAVPAGGGERIWYFTDADGGVRLGPRLGVARFSARAVTIDAAHPTGVFDVHVFLSERPLGRAEMLAAPAEGVRFASRLQLQILEE